MVVVSIIIIIINRQFDSIINGKYASSSVK